MSHCGTKVRDSPDLSTYLQDAIARPCKYVLRSETLFPMSHCGTKVRDSPDLSTYLQDAIARPCKYVLRSETLFPMSHCGTKVRDSPDLSTYLQKHRDIVCSKCFYQLIYTHLLIFKLQS
ncbi:hypothetical protein TVAG_410700 [Trichomonas vaginalis G3]|uniref:Uncharacterized protein n=1 Tax=Trichomonas vaginalis (strain ATCC PRA-98 / G3) TaxID=412133 RepID=A2FU59_TRIV3|nr:hypothetical protein TVAGG3_0597740 [Trichomonas vaginalis G3]EAX91557.1 hypothetical protein TVAG_410700 [Trichomonas vaginalis G3]KAI5523718.1 hypothetical protein TVAGG3_0597740 [Trichomonas vaginalis G3]|eukprot:XP_001304487.1 hypothetical protein [Trichomonas vaginalis G3]